ncbi:MAG: hypothetical protein J7K54_01780 [Candidatus Aenigmarchaeota archaeon]|nr:hypothetical protein [Candidatus Aenigmarchaeota archaeon]
MSEGPLIVIFKMVALVIDNTVGTLTSIMGLTGDLFSSLSVVLSVGGGIGVVVFVGVLGIAGFFVFKFVLGSMKTLGMLILVALAIIAFLVVGFSIF